MAKDKAFDSAGQNFLRGFKGQISFPFVTVDVACEPAGSKVWPTIVKKKRGNKGLSDRLVVSLINIILTRFSTSEHDRMVLCSYLLSS